MLLARFEVLNPSRKPRAWGERRREIETQRSARFRNSAILRISDFEVKKNEISQI